MKCVYISQTRKQSRCPFSDRSHCLPNEVVTAGPCSPCLLGTCISPAEPICRSSPPVSHGAEISIAWSQPGVGWGETAQGVFGKLFNQGRTMPRFLMLNLWSVNDLAIKRKLVFEKLTRSLRCRPWNTRKQLMPFLPLRAPSRLQGLHMLLSLKVISTPSLWQVFCPALGRPPSPQPPPVGRDHVWWIIGSQGPKSQFLEFGVIMCEPFLHYDEKCPPPPQKKPKTCLL